VIKPRVFISYVHENRSTVLRLVTELRRHGVDVWFDREALTPGVFWRDEIRSAVRAHGYFVACFSKEYNSRIRTYMNEELELAVDELRQRGNSRWFIPALLSGEMPDRAISASRNLRDIQYVDLSDANWESGVAALLFAMGIDKLPQKPQKKRFAVTATPPPAENMQADPADVRNFYLLPDTRVCLTLHATGPDTLGQFFFIVSNESEFDISDVKLTVQIQPRSPLRLRLGNIESQTDSRYVSLDEAEYWNPRGRPARDRRVSHAIEQLNQLLRGRALPIKHQIVMSYRDTKRVMHRAVYRLIYRQSPEDGIPIMIMTERVARKYRAVAA
jgi:hypothetical protein